MVVHMAVVAVHRVVVRMVVVPVHTDSNNWVAVHREVVVDLGHYTSVIIASFKSSHPDHKISAVQRIASTV
jgi:hypothetical protein